MPSIQEQINIANDKLNSVIHYPFDVVFKIPENIMLYDKNQNLIFSNKKNGPVPENPITEEELIKRLNQKESFYLYSEVGSVARILSTKQSVREDAKLDITVSKPMKESSYTSEKMERLPVPEMPTGLMVRNWFASTFLGRESNQFKALDDQIKQINDINKRIDERNKDLDQRVDIINKLNVKHAEKINNFTNEANDKQISFADDMINKVRSNVKVDKAIEIDDAILGSDTFKMLHENNFTRFKDSIKGLPEGTDVTDKFKQTLEDLLTDELLKFNTNQTMIDNVNKINTNSGFNRISEEKTYEMLQNQIANIISLSCAIKEIGKNNITINNNDYEQHVNSILKDCDKNRDMFNSISSNAQFDIQNKMIIASRTYAQSSKEVILKQDMKEYNNVLNLVSNFSNAIYEDFNKKEWKKEQFEKVYNEKLKLFSNLKKENKEIPESEINKFKKSVDVLYGSYEFKKHYKEKNDVVKEALENKTVKNPENKVKTKGNSFIKDNVFGING